MNLEPAGDLGYRESGADADREPRHLVREPDRVLLLLAPLQRAPASACATPAAGQNLTSYVLSAADVGYTLRVSVFARNAAGQTQHQLETRRPSSAPPPSPHRLNLSACRRSPAPRKVGQTLTASPGTWSGSPTAYFYYWTPLQRRPATPAQPSPARTVTTYILTSADVGYTLRAAIFASNAAGTDLRQLQHRPPAVSA